MLKSYFFSTALIWMVYSCGTVHLLSPLSACETPLYLVFLKQSWIWTKEVIDLFLETSEQNRRFIKSKSMHWHCKKNATKKDLHMLSFWGVKCKNNEQACQKVKTVLWWHKRQVCFFFIDQRFLSNLSQEAPSEIIMHPHPVYRSARCPQYMKAMSHTKPANYWSVMFLWNAFSEICGGTSAILGLEAF